MDRSGRNLTRRLGLVGGFGIAAGVYYYRELAKACEALGVALDLVLIHADIDRTREYVDAHDHERLDAVECAGRCLQVHGVGGDGYEFTKLPDGQMAVAIGDASGRGFAASPMISAAQASLLDFSM